MIARLRRLLRLPVVQNASALYGAQLATYLLPFVTIPYLARVLGPSVWGHVALAQALGLYAMLVVEYGFNLSASRELARERDDLGRRAELMAGVSGAKLLLSLGCLALLALAQLLVPGLRELGALLWAGLLWGLAQALRPFWFFLGLERLRLVTVVDLASRLAAVLGIFWLVRNPGDGLRVLAIQATAAALSMIVALVLAYRLVPVRLPRLGDAWRSLGEGSPVFLLRAATSLYTMSNVFILGLVAPAATVGLYAGAEKLYRALYSLMDPVGQALYPRASALARESEDQAARVARLTAAGMGLAGLVAAGAVFLAAPLVVRLVLGPDFGSSVAVLRVLALLLPILGVSASLGMQWLLPLGLDRLLTRIALSAGALHLLLATAMAARYGALGAAWALVVTELIALGLIWTSLTRRQLNPFLDRGDRQARTATKLGGTLDAR